MTELEIETKVREVLSKKFSIPPERIALSSRLAEDLGVDSFGGIELMFELEEAFGIQIPDSGIEHILTVRDIVECVVRMSGKASGAPPT